MKLIDPLLKFNEPFDGNRDAIHAERLSMRNKIVKSGMDCLDLLQLFVDTHDNEP